jgi:hypothetical protein
MNLNCRKFVEQPRVSLDELSWRGKKLLHDGVLVAQIGIQTDPPTSRYAVAMAYGYSVIGGFSIKEAKHHAEILALDVLNLSERQHDIQMHRDEYYHDASRRFH